MSRYLLDANVFIAANRLHYGRDFCPAFWDWLTESNRAGRVFSIERVANELRAVDDPVSVWAEPLGDDCFIPLSSSDEPALGRVAEWVNTQHYEPAAISTFLQVADHYLVTQALDRFHVDAIV